jgi:hypothetical protein
MEYQAAMQLLASRSPAAAREAARTIRRLSIQSPVAAQVARRVIATGLGDPEAELSLEERDELAALLAGDVGGRILDIRLRVTPEEKRRIQAMADAERLTVSDFVRERIGLSP